VDPQPNRPPTVSCSASPSSVQPGSRVHITAVASDPDNDPLTFSWESTGGQVVGSGSEVDLDTIHAAASHYIVTGHVSDGRGGTAVCHAEITLQAPAAEAKLTIRSIYFPTALPLPAAPDKGLAESQLRTLTSLASDSRSISQANPMRVSSCKAMQIAAEHRHTIKLYPSAASKLQNASLSDLAHRKQIFRPKRMGKKTT
jgi:hypothetical protein